MKKFFVFNAGCIRRGLDVIWIRKYLTQNGYTEVSSPKGADLIVVATCGVVEENEKKSLAAVTKAQKARSSTARIIVTGCLPNIHPQAIEVLGPATLIPTNSIQQIDDVIHARVPLSQVTPPDSVTEGRDVMNYLIARSFCRKSSLYRYFFNRYFMNNHFLAVSVWFIKRFIPIKPYYNIAIARGCRSDCTFCATKLAIGGLQSKRTDDIVSEFRHGVSQGYKIIQLISEDTGCYGLDIGTTFPDLLQRLLAMTPRKCKINVVDFHPRWLVKYQDVLVPMLIKKQEKIKELFIPIQSGSDSILSLMKRNHTVGEIKPLLQRLIKEASAISLRTCVIVGFPGETQEDFEATAKMIREVRFAEVDVNRYEDRPNTPSSSLPGKVGQDVIESRALYLTKELGCHMLS